MNYETFKSTYLPRLKELGGAALVAVLLGCSMSLTLMDALAVSFSLWQVGMIAVLTALVCVAMLYGRATALGATLCVSGGVAYAIIRHGSLMKIIKETTVSLLTVLVGGEGSLNEHALFLMLALTIVFTLIAFMLTRLSGGVYPALLMYMFVLLSGWYLEKRLIPAYAVPGLVGLAVLYARAHRETGGYLRAVPAALLAALLAVTLLPAGDMTWKPLSDAAGKVRELFSDYFMFTDPRTVYSVSSDGYQPQGEILGGPAQPRDAEIMTVKTDRLLMMRGSVRRTYTGYSWVDNSFNSRYLFIDPTRQGLRDTVFDVDLTPALDGLLTEITGEVTILNEGTSTLFVPHRLKSLSLPLELAAYFNDSGEVFITRGVQYEDHYEFTAYALTAGQEELNQRIRSVVPGTDSDYPAIKEGYMNLPAGLDNDVYWLTQELIADADTPYEKALAIQKHLLSDAYTYQLDVELPPQGRDFVSYFLLDRKEGYCTYYASAMAVMARLAGLPSRYVEGYLVPAEPDGETLVTGDNAHAWVEIYFEGIGWIPFDATPGDQNGERNNAPQANEPTPTPTATPTPTPSPSPTPDRGDADEPDDNHDDATATPAPTDTPAPDSDNPDGSEPTPTPDPGEMTPEPSASPDETPERQKAKQILRLLFMIMGILLLLLVATILLIRRLRSTDPKLLAARQKSDKAKLMIWYRAILTLLMRSGYVPEGGETPERFAQRMVAENAAPEQLLELTRIIGELQYARIKPAAGSLKLAREVYERMIMKLRPAERIRWHMYRLCHGIGDFNQIP